MEHSVFRQVRYSLYLAVILNGIIQWVVPFQYQCSVTGEPCFACGLRTAVTLSLQGDFPAAYQSNPLIAAIVMIGLAMAADVLHALYQRRKGKRHRSI